jgi:hypothetical protein
MTQATANSVTEAEPANWQQGFAAEIQRSQGGCGLRVSSAGRCVRRQTYAASGAEETDEGDDRSPARLALGHALEVLIVLNLRNADWETQWTVLDGGQSELALAEMPFVRGHPDGICRHPKHTNNMWVTLECKSMGSNRADLVFADGVFAHYEEYRSQIALYGRQMYREGKVDHPERGVFAMMDREGKPMTPERVAWAPHHFDEAVERLKVAKAHADAGTLPERPYQPDDENCVFCPFRTRCWELDATPAPAGRAVWKSQGNVTLNDSKLEKRVANYAAAMRDRREVTKVLEEQCQLYGDATVEVGGLVAGYFYPPDSVTYDDGKLAQHMTAEQIRECRAAPPTRRFWIRPASNRR